jgi:hypothetical protein
MRARRSHRWKASLEPRSALALIEQNARQRIRKRKRAELPRLGFGGEQVAALDRASEASMCRAL